MSMDRLEQYCIENGWEIHFHGLWPEGHWFTKMHNKDYIPSIYIKKCKCIISRNIEIAMNINNIIKEMIEYDKSLSDIDPQYTFDF